MPAPAARVNDMHVCPAMSPGVPPIPHVGGAITGPGAITVLVGGQPAACVGDMAQCAPPAPPNVIAAGSATVLFGGRPVARMGDATAHGGNIMVGCPQVIVGG